MERGWSLAAGRAGDLDRLCRPRASSGNPRVDEARPADVILVLGAAEYRGRPSPVLRARLDHALDLYRRKLAPRILTTGGAGGDPVFTEGGVGRSYLISHGVPSEAIIVETEGESTVHSTALAGEIMRPHGPPFRDRGQRRLPHLPREEDARNSAV